MLTLVLAASVVSTQESDDGEEPGIRKAGDIVQIVIPATALASTFIAKDKEGTFQFLKSLSERSSTTTSTHS